MSPLREITIAVFFVARKRHTFQEQDVNAYIHLTVELLCLQLLTNRQGMQMSGGRYRRGGYFAIDAAQIRMGLRSVLATLSDTIF